MVPSTSLRPAPAAASSPSRPRRSAPSRAGAALAGALTVLVVALGLAVVPAGAPAGAAAAATAAVEGEQTPLSVRIHRLTPSSVPRSGPVRVTGTVTNDDDVVWSTVRVYAFMSETPMTTPAELAAAAAVDPAMPVGERIIDEGTYDTLASIDPGQTLPFSIQVPRSALPAEQPGVYWFGVHALGSDGGPAETEPTADGRARTFLPLVSDRATPVETAVVLPLRRSVVHAGDGSVADVEEWTRALGPRGRLGQAVEVAEVAGSRTVSWLVDPAVLDAVARLAAGNPPRSLGPTVEEPGGEDDADSQSESPSATAEPEEGGSPPPSPTEDGTEPGEEGDDGGAEEPDPVTEAAAEAATAWLKRFRDAVEGDEVLALPYGDVDVAAAAEHDPALFREARERSARAMNAWDLDADPAVAPLDGYLDVDGLLLAERDDTVLVSDRMVPGRSAVVTIGGQALVTTSSAAAEGGPGPDDARSAVALRQRVLAEAAVRTRGLGGALVVPFPLDGRARLAGFFAGLDASWLELTDVDDVGTEPPRPLTNRDLRYPEAQELAEVGAENFAAARALTRSGESLQNILPRNDLVGSVIADQALSGVSYAARDDGGAARLALDAAREEIEGLLSSIQITAPRGVTLSSSSGRFAATVSNGLDQPVTVQVEALADRPLDVAAPDPVTIAPGGRTTVLLEAHTDRVGVHNVTLLVTDGAGTPLGSTDRLPVRSAQVSAVIWLIIAAGAGLLLAAILVRLVRRLRARRPGPTGLGNPSAPATEASDPIEAIDPAAAPSQTESRPAQQPHPNDPNDPNAVSSPAGRAERQQEATS